MSHLTGTFRVFFLSSFRTSVLIAALAFLICLFAAQSAQAQLTLTVTRTDDRNTTCVSGVDCSLREAVNAANAGATNDAINFLIPAGNTGCTSGVCTITLTLGALVVNSASTAGTLTIINATGASNLQISGNNTSRVFSVNSGGNLTINGVTITNGRTGSNDGGGISNNGTLTLTNSTVSGNTATNEGGGIYNLAGSQMTLTNSKVSGNTANNGGGIFNEEGDLNLTSVTVTNNRSTSTDCANCAGGISSNPLDITNLKNTIVAGNTADSASASPDFGGVVSSTSSYNIIGNGQGMTGITNGTNGNQVGSSLMPIDPKLGALANNGGATQTHALLSDSPAIDKGSSFGLSTDQRGFARPFDNPSITNATGGDGADIGAFERQTAPTAATVSISGRVTTASGRGIKNVRLTLTDSSGQIRTATTSSFGYYRFDDVLAGETYILSAVGKRYTFSQPVRVLSINDAADGVDFIADSK